MFRDMWLTHTSSVTKINHNYLSFIVKHTMEKTEINVKYSELGHTPPVL